LGKRWPGIGVSSWVLGVLICGPVWAGAFDGEELLKKGTLEWGVKTGYGLTNGVGPARAGVDFFGFLPRVGYVFTQLQGKPPWKGSLEGGVEAVPVLLAFESTPAFGSRTIYGGGLTAFLHYDLHTGTRLVPFLEGGAGLLLSTPQSRDPVSQFRASQFNFTLQIGVGLRYVLSQRAALSVEYRFHHLSDAGLTESNPGFNADFLLVGFSLFR